MNEDAAFLIPFYLNRTLSAEEMQAVEAALLADESARAEFFHWLEVKNNLDAVGRVRAETAAPADPARFLMRLKKRTTLYIPLRKASARYLRVPAWAWQPAAVLIVLLQFAAIALLVTGARMEKSVALRTLSDAPVVAAVAAPSYNVVFLPQTSEEQIRVLLLRYRAQFVEGPNRVGKYRVRFAALAPEQAEAFRSEPIVQFMEKSL